jgi:FixJ family two-component response regulator
MPGSYAARPNATLDDARADTEDVARLCTICPHPRRLEIERAIIAGGALRFIASRKGVSPSSIRSHRDSHLRTTLQKALEDERIATDAGEASRPETGAEQPETRAPLARRTAREGRERALA